MTIPRILQEATGRVSDMVRGMIPRRRYTPSKEEIALGVHLKGNAPLYEALIALLKSRIEGRAVLAEPNDPLVCKSMMARDRELQWLLSKLESIYRAPIEQHTQDDGEPPA